MHHHYPPATGRCQCERGQLLGQLFGPDKLAKSAGSAENEEYRDAPYLSHAAGVQPCPNHCLPGLLCLKKCVPVNHQGCKAPLLVFCQHAGACVLFQFFSSAGGRYPPIRSPRSPWMSTSRWRCWWPAGCYAHHTGAAGHLVGLAGLCVGSDRGKELWEQIDLIAAMRDAIC